MRSSTFILTGAATGILAARTITAGGAAEDIAVFTSLIGKSDAGYMSRHETVTSADVAEMFARIALVTDGASILHHERAPPIQTDTANLFVPGVAGTATDYLVAKPLGEDSTATTYLIGCRADALGTRKYDALSDWCGQGMPLTMTQGPATVDFQRTLTWDEGSQTATLTEHLQCALEGTTSADCTVTTHAAAKDYAYYTYVIGPVPVEATNRRATLTGTKATSLFSQMPLVTDGASIMYFEGAPLIRLETATFWSPDFLGPEGDALVAQSLGKDSTATTYLVGCDAAIDLDGGVLQNDVLSSYCGAGMPLTMTQGRSTVHYRKEEIFKEGATLTHDYQCSLAGTTKFACTMTIDGADADMAQFKTYMGEQYAEYISQVETRTGTVAEPFFASVALVTDGARIMHYTGASSVPTKTASSGASGIENGKGMVTSMATGLSTKTAEAGSSASSAPTVEGDAGKMMRLGAWAVAMVAGVIGVAAL